MCSFVCFVSRVRVYIVPAFTPLIDMCNLFCDVNVDVLSNIMQFLEPIQVLVSICEYTENPFIFRLFVKVYS